MGADLNYVLKIGKPRKERKSGIEQIGVGKPRMGQQKDARRQSLLESHSVQKHLFHPSLLDRFQ